MIGLHTAVHEFVALFSTFSAKWPNILLDYFIDIQLKPFNVYFLVCSLRKYLSLHRRHVDWCMIRGDKFCVNRVLAVKERQLMYQSCMVYTPRARDVFKSITFPKTGTR